MSNQLDERIRAFVAELVDDPPAIPSFPDPQVGTVLIRPDKTRRYRFGRPFSGPAVAVTVFVLLLVLGTLVVVLRPGGPPREVATEPSTPTTRVASPETFLGVPVEPVVPFRAQVRYTMVEAANEDASYHASIGVSYLGPGVFRAEIESTNPESGPYSLAERSGEGSYIVTDGTSAASYLAARDLFLRFPAEENATLDLGELGWRHWADRCRQVENEIAEETTILSRQALHVRCAELGDDIEVWVDIETGVVLSAHITPTFRVVGDMPIADELGSYADGFQVADLELDAALGGDLFAVSAPPGSEEHQIARQHRWVVAGNANCGVDCAQADVTRLSDHPLVGSVAPPLTGELLDGTSFDLSTLRGERVALLWWASWCAPSLDLLVGFDQQAKERPDINFIGVLLQDQPDKAKGVVERGGISIPTLDTGDIDEPGQNADWRVGGCPTTVLVAEDGTLKAGMSGAWPTGGMAAFLAQAGW